MRSTLTRLLVPGLAFGIATAVTRIVAGERRRRQDKATLHEEVERWEGEGGQVPGATIGAPANAPESRAHAATH